MSSIIKTDPANLQVNVPLNQYIKITFNRNLDASSVTGYTVILAESETEDIVSGITEYFHGTREARFRLHDYLKESTDYTLIIVGGESGILFSGGAPALPDNYIVRFKTWDKESVDRLIEDGADPDDYLRINPDWPFAKHTPYDFPSQPFYSHEDNLHTMVYHKTGKPVSHIVTTDGNPNPDGDMTSGDSPDSEGSVYLSPADEEELKVVDVDMGDLGKMS